MCCCSRQYVTLSIYWLTSPRNLHLAISSSSKSWKNRQYRKLQAMMDSLLTTSDLCMELQSGEYCVSSLLSSQVVKVLGIVLFVKDHRRSRFPNRRLRHLARLLASHPLISASPSSTFCFHISRHHCQTSSRNLLILSSNFPTNNRMVVPYFASLFLVVDTRACSLLKHFSQLTHILFYILMSPDLWKLIEANLSIKQF